MYLCARERVLLHNLWPDASSAPRPSFSRKPGVCVGGEGPDERKNNGTPGSLTRVFRLGKSDQVDRSDSSLLAGKDTTKPQG